MPAGTARILWDGPNVRIMADTWALSVLARIGHPECRPPVLHDLIASAYWRLLHATVDGSEDAPVTLVLAHGWTLAQAAGDGVPPLLAPIFAGRKD